jgi:hypothetical protein
LEFLVARRKNSSNYWQELKYIITRRSTRFSVITSVNSVSLHSFSVFLDLLNGLLQMLCLLNIVITVGFIGAEDSLLHAFFKPFYSFHGSEFALLHTVALRESIHNEGRCGYYAE